MKPLRRSEVVFPELEPPEEDKGGAWPVFIVLLVSVAVAFTVAAWALGRIVWGVVV